jgi:hypothetical protein
VAQWLAFGHRLSASIGKARTHDMLQKPADIDSCRKAGVAALRELEAWWMEAGVPDDREALHGRLAAILRAIELNGVQVENNKAAFEWGRRCAHDLASVTALFKAQQVIQFVKKPGLEEMVKQRVSFLTGYQDAAYAAQYQAFVDKVRSAEVQADRQSGRAK